MNFEISKPVFIGLITVIVIVCGLVATIVILSTSNSKYKQMLAVADNRLLASQTELLVSQLEHKKLMYTVLLKTLDAEDAKTKAQREEIQKKLNEIEEQRKKAQAELDRRTAELKTKTMQQLIDATAELLNRTKKP